MGQPQVTLLLRSIEQTPDAAGKLLPLIYDELRAIARDRLRSERAGHTLQATALRLRLAETVRATRRFVRRQRTWFRRDPSVVWLDAADPDLVDRALAVVRET